MLRAVPGGPRALRRRVPPRARRRVPGHQPRAVPAAAAARPASTATSRSSATTRSRSTASAAPTSATSWTSRTTSRTPRSSSSSRTTARRRRSSTPPTRSSPTTAARCTSTLWTDLGDGDPIKVRELDDEHAEARFVVGEIERLVDEGVSRAEIAVFYRTNAQSRVLEDTLVRARDRLPGHRRHEVLRARRDQGRDRLPARCSPTRRTSISFTRIANSPRRGIGQTSLSRVLAHAETMGIRSGRRPPTRRACPASARPRCKAFGRFMATMERAARARRPAASRSATCSRRSLHETGYLEALEAERTIEAQGRTENLEELVEVAREFDAPPRSRAALGPLPAAGRRSSPTPTRARTTRAS